MVEAAAAKAAAVCLPRLPACLRVAHNERSLRMGDACHTRYVPVRRLGERERRRIVTMPVLRQLLSVRISLLEVSETH